MAAHPLTLVDIEAWCRLHCLRLTSWELDTLLALDAKTFDLAAQRQARQTAAQKAKP